MSVHQSLYDYSLSILLVWFKWHCSFLAPLMYLICLNRAFYPFVTFIEPGQLLTAAQTIATSLIDYRFNYYNSLFLKLPRCQLVAFILLSTLQLELFPRFSHFSPFLKSIHCLKIDQRIQ